MKLNWQKVLEWVRKLLTKWNKKGGGKMKMALVLLTTILLGISSSVVVAQDTSLISIPSSFTARQGMGMMMSDQAIMNTTTFEVLETRPVASWPRWANALYDGITIDAGFAYDASSADNAILVFSRHINAWEQYLPIKLPDFMNKIDLSINAGPVIRHFSTSPKADAISGMAYVKASIAIP